MDTPAFFVRGDDMMINIIIALILGLQVQATALPVPSMFPADVQIWDTLFNVFGLTRPEVSDDKRLEAYADLYRNVLGATYEQFADDMNNIITDGKTSGQLVLPPEIVTQLETGMDYAIKNGVSNMDGSPEEYKTLAQWRAWLAMHGMSVPEAQLNWFWGESEGTGVCYLGYVRLDTNRTLMFSTRTEFTNPVHAAVFAGDQTKQRFIDAANGAFAFRYRIYDTAGNVIPDAYMHQDIRNSMWSWTTYGKATGAVYNTRPLSSTKSTVTPYALQIAERMANAVLRVLTPDTQLTIDGTYDITQPTIIRIPAIWATPATTVDGIPTIQDETQTRPYIDDSIPLTDQIAALRTQADTDYGDAEKYRIDLTEFFPFCIPWDLQLLMQSFQAEPEAPVIDWPFPVGYEDGEIKMEVFTLDLSIWDTVAQYVRLGELALYIVGLAVATRHIYIRG